MKPLFTIHGGEYLVGEQIERLFKQRINVWVPSRDSGIDLLVTDRRNRRAVSLQVKFSRDFLPNQAAEFQKSCRAWSWFVIDREKLQQSPADFWIFVLLGFARRTTDFVVVPPKELWRRFRAIQSARARRTKFIQSYLWVTEDDHCWETRGLTQADRLRVAEGRFRDSRRDFTKWLNDWSPIAKLR
jgi:hypothetical protein